MDASAGFSTRHGHGRCLVCGENARSPLKLAFAPRADGSVGGSFVAGRELQGYDDMVHGGVIATWLDAAMTHCLFHRGITAMTADLHVRYVRPIACGNRCEIGAYLVEATPPLYRLRAEIVVEGAVGAWAEAKFLTRRGRSPAGR